MQRKFAAILAADVVGYCALMEKDEAGTYDRLRAGRKELFEPEIERHHARIFKLMGDGPLAEFTSVIDAVECRVSLQRGLAVRNASVPEHSEFSFKLGSTLASSSSKVMTAMGKASTSQTRRLHGCDVLSSHDVAGLCVRQCPQCSARGTPNNPPVIGSPNGASREPFAVVWARLRRSDSTGGTSRASLSLPHKPSSTALPAQRRSTRSRPTSFATSSPALRSRCRSCSRPRGAMTVSSMSAPRDVPTSGSIDRRTPKARCRW